MPLTTLMQAEHRAAGDEPPWPRITYVQADEELLPLARHSVDGMVLPCLVSLSPMAGSLLCTVTNLCPALASEWGGYGAKYE